MSDGRALAIGAGAFVLVGLALAARASASEAPSGDRSSGGDPVGDLESQISSAVDSLMTSLGGQTRGERNNNPGNIVRTSIAWQGKVHGTDNVFETFDSPQNGVRALSRTLLNYQRQSGLSTVRGIVTRWAPPSENDTESYIRNVAARLNVAPDAILNLENADTLAALTAAIIQQENGRNLYAAVIPAAVQSALA